MSKLEYYLRWRGENSGPYTSEQMRRMWDAGQISGAYQVSTGAGMLLVQDFLPQLEEAAADERLREQKAFKAKAEAEQQRLDQAKMGAENARLQKAQQDRISQEEKNIQAISDKKAGKIYQVYMNGEKRGPFSKEQVSIYLNGGKLKTNSLVWTEDIGEWVSLNAFPEFKVPATKLDAQHAQPEQFIGQQHGTANSVPVNQQSNSGFPGTRAMMAFGMYQRNQMHNELEEMNERLDEGVEESDFEPDDEGFDFDF